MQLSADNTFKKLIIIGDRVLVRPTTPHERTESGLYLPPGVQEREKVQQGLIIKTGPGYAIPLPPEDEPWKQSEEAVKYLPLQAREGDLAIFLVSGATEIMYGGDKYFIVPQSAILMVEREDAADSLNAWPYRKDKVAAQILFHDAHLVGVQEALPGQMTELAGLLPHYRYVGVGREDGKEKGEFSAIFYDTGRLRVERTETFWLSKEPTVPGSKSWDAAITRIVTWARFRDKRTGKVFYHFNTHFDHIGQEARRESARMLLRRVAEIGGRMPVLITGDFNAKPSDEPIRILQEASDPLHLTNAKAVSARPHYGPDGTFNGFGPKERDNEPIDHIFIKNGIRVLRHATLSQTWAGRFSSDHFPVFATISIP